MDASDTLEALIGKTKTNDNEVKIDAIVKLQHAFEANATINDPDPVFSALKLCLRTPNHHLAAATLNTVHALVLRIFPVLSNPSSPSGSSMTSNPSLDSYTTSNSRQALLAFLPAPGVIDRLGESREAPRTTAKQIIVVLGLSALANSDLTVKKHAQKGRTPDTPIGIFESNFRELGLGSKVARVRQQSLLALVQLRQENPHFPLRPYLPSIVDLLEDPDGSVRDSARQSTILLFSAASESARTDLKREMTRKGVRKAIAEGVLSGLILSSTNSGTFTPPGSSRSQSEFSGSEGGGEGTPMIPSASSLSSTATIPPMPTPVSRSVSGPPRLLTQTLSELPRGGTEAPLGEEVVLSASRAVSPVFIASARDLESEFAKMPPHFEGKETEHNWASRELSINSIRGMIKGDAHLRYETTFLSCLRAGILESSFKALGSLRTTVASNTCHLYIELAVAFGPSFDPLVDAVLKQLLKMSGFTKKITAKESQASVDAIISHTSAQPRIIIPLLNSFLQEKNAQTRQYMIGHVKHYIEVHGQSSQAAIESHGGLEVLDSLLRKGLQDSNPTVKATARGAFWSFDAVWHSHAWSILGALDTQGRKQLEKANPNPDPQTPTCENTQPPLKKSSVAAAIAASKAKAKAIASAPPTLRHAATSNATSATHKATSPVAAMTDPLSRRASTPTRTPAGPSSVLRRTASPIPSPNSRLNPPSRPVSVTLTPPPNPNSHRRVCTSPSPPTSPTSELAMRRRALSPLAAGTSPPRSPSIRTSELPRSISPPNFIQQLLPSSNRNRTSSIPLSRLQAANAPRDSTNMLVNIDTDDSLLMAIQNPLPQDSDSETEAIGATQTEPRPRTSYDEPSRQDGPTDSTNSPAQSTSPTLYPGDSVSQSASVTFPPTIGAPIHDVLMEDAIRAAAEQAESSADRLNELMDDGPSTPSVPADPLRSYAASPESRRTQPGSVDHSPVTPAPRQMNGKTKYVSLFQSSPAVKDSPSLMDRLYENKHESGWWLKRKSLLDRGTPLKADQSTHDQELRSHIKALVDGTADVRTLQKLTLLCNAHPALETDEEDPSLGLSSPLAIQGSDRMLESDLWRGGRMFDAVFKPLVRFLSNTQNLELIEYGLCILLEMVENQLQYIDESRLVSLLFHVRHANTHPILEATNTIRDALVSRQEPVWGLKSLHGCLLEYLAEPLPTSLPPKVASSVRTSSHAFGIVGIGKLILRLPAEVLEDELPLLKTTLFAVLDSRDPFSTTVREAAYGSIVAAQSVLRNEAKLFSLLDGIETSKKNLLTYYFDKHDVRGPIEGVTASQSAKEGEVDEKVIKELLRLDNKTSTPVKTS